MDALPVRFLRARPRLVLALAFVLLAIVHTWPLAAAPATNSRLDSADASLNTWAIAWVAHTLPTHPTAIADANIFYPAPLTFAYSEPLLVQGVLAMPVLALGGSPILAFNLVLLAGFALTAWAASLLILRATGSMAAALVAGSLAAFNAHTLTRLPHLQAQHLEFLPVALLALDRLMAVPRVADAVLLGVSVALQALASIYALIFTAWALAWAAIARGWPHGRRWHSVALGFLAVAVTAVLLAPVLYPYYRLSHDLGLERSVAESRLFSSTWTDYLFTGARIHFEWWGHRFSSSADANFPGIVATALAALAIWTGLRRDRWVRMAASMLVGCVILSVAPQLPGFVWAHDHLPLVSAIRGYSRAGQFALVAVAILAGLGVARLRERWGDRRGWTAAAAGMVLLVNGEALRAPLTYVPFEGVPRIYDSLAAAPPGAVLELPIYGPGAIWQNAPYLVNSTRHWRPLVNGYSGFVPPGYNDIYRGFRRFPDEWSVAWLRQHGVNQVVVHVPEFEALKGTPQLRKIEECPDVALAFASDEIRVYRVLPAP